MSHNSPRVVHITPRVQAHGGTETLHNYHRHLPGEQVFVALFDRAPERRLNYINLGFTWRTPLREMRRRFTLALAPLAGRLVIYHDGWGLPLFHDLDQSSRRVVMLHSDPAYHAAALPGLAGLIDGALAITPAVQRTVAIALPELVEDRTHHCQVPIELPPERIAKKAGGPLIFGYVGRLERAQKRLDRLPKFIRAMRATGTEGGPIGLLEGMAAGAVPFYPAQGGSWADVYVPQVDPWCHYPPADMPALAQAIHAIFQRPVEQLDHLRKRSRELVLAHTPENYLIDCHKFISRISVAARISRSEPRRARLSDLLPLGWATRMAPRLLTCR